MLVQTVESMSKKFNLDIRNLSEVFKLNQEENSKICTATRILINLGYKALNLDRGWKTYSSVYKNPVLLRGF